MTAQWMIVFASVSLLAGVSQPQEAPRKQGFVAGRVASLAGVPVAGTRVFTHERRKAVVACVAGRTRSVARSSGRLELALTLAERRHPINPTATVQSRSEVDSFITR